MNDLYRGWVIKVRGRIVEGQVSVDADTQKQDRWEPLLVFVRTCLPIARGRPLRIGDELQRTEAGQTEPG